MSSIIRKVRLGDEKALAYIQTESWKAAFQGIIPDDILKNSTDIKRSEKMYFQLLNDNKGNGYILEVDGKAHCMSYWDSTREKEMSGYAEIICIHSLQNKWHQGYGSQMIKYILNEIKTFGYNKVMLWVFEENIRAINFYKKHGFISNGRHKEFRGATEIMFERCL